MTAPVALSILFVGDSDRTEFREARADLDQWGTVSEFAKAESAAAALRENIVTPDLIVVGQTFPGQYSHADIDQLRRLAPLARVIGLMGSWCEGEMRTGSPWPAVVRNYWHQWPARSHRQLGRLARGENCAWTLPPTATEEERLLLDAADETASPDHSPPRTPAGRGLIVIFSRSRVMAQWISAALRSRGYATARHDSPAVTQVEGAVAAVFDGTDLGPQEQDELRRFATFVHPAPIVALSAFPRTTDRERALSAGAAAIVSKPIVVDDLFDEIERAVTSNNGR